MPRGSSTRIRRRTPTRSAASRRSRSRWNCSTRPTRSGRTRLVDDRDQVALLDDIALVDRELLDHPVGLGEYRDLHLHRLENDQGVALGHLVPGAGDHLPHVGHHLGPDLLRHRPASLLSPRPTHSLPRRLAGQWFRRAISIQPRSAARRLDRMREVIATFALEVPMAKKARKKKARKKSAANHGKRPNS